MKRFFLLLVLTYTSLFLFSGCKYFQENDANIGISWDNKGGRSNIRTSYIQVPAGKYDKIFSEVVGEKEWKTAQELFKKRAGIVKFMAGDVFSVTTAGNKILSYDLHNYRNRSSGQKISFEKVGPRYRKHVKDISLEIRTVVKHFSIKESFFKDYPVFYEMARERLLWDWGILDKLEKGDSVALLIKGIFDNDIIVHTYGILGVSIKSASLGDFSLTAFRDYLYGDYFTTTNRVILSPPGELRTPLDSGRITSFFGYRKDPFNRRKKFHNGIDIIAKKNAPVRAADAGIVTFVGRKGRLGKTVVINHGNGMKTLYGHLNKYLIRSGRHVQKGEVIAGAGSTGRSTATHLHFTVLVDGKPVDPLNYTYERVWTPPFDINGDFRGTSIARAGYLEEAISKRKTIYVEEKVAKAKTK